MIFSSLSFLFLFLPILLIVYYISKDNYKNYILLIFSLFFYSWLEPKYILLMILSIIMNYYFAKKIDKRKRKRKQLLIISIIVNLSFLIFFKYNNKLPLGISFYIFQEISYLIDIYKKKVRLEKNIFYFGTYISFFPQLIAGPIVRYKDIEKELRKRKYTFNEFELELKNKGIDLNSLKKKNKENEESIEITKELFNCIPGMKESGWTYEDYKQQCENEKMGDNANFLFQCRNIINKLRNHSNSWPYREPVDANEVQDYYQKIKEPMDLQTLEKGVESGKYKNKTAFVKDLKKIFNNARTYNKAGTIYYKYATNLEEFIEEDIKKLKEF